MRLILLTIFIAFGCGSDLDPTKKRTKKVIEVQDGKGCDVTPGGDEDSYSAVITCGDDRTEIPKPKDGVDGAAGAAGPQGDRGATGSPGSRGPSGSRGPTGPAGPSGQAGSDGADGNHGRDGQDGRDGRDGHDGQGMDIEDHYRCEGQFWYNSYRYPLRVDITRYTTGHLFYRFTETEIRRRDGVTTWVDRSSLMWSAVTEDFVLNGVRFTAAFALDLSDVWFTNIEELDRVHGTCTSVETK